MFNLEVFDFFFVVVEKLCYFGGLIKKVSGDVKVIFVVFKKT
jgi:hypothetical protein